jgi:hypothetical protein
LRTKFIQFITTDTVFAVIICEYKLQIVRNLHGTILYLHNIAIIVGIEGEWQFNYICICTLIRQISGLYIKRRHHVILMSLLKNLPYLKNREEN